MKLFGIKFTLNGFERELKIPDTYYKWQLKILKKGVPAWNKWRNNFEE